MKKANILAQVSRAIVSAFCVAVVAAPQSLFACAGSSGVVCVVNPAACLKSMALTKSVATVVVFPPGGPALVTVANTLFITCPPTNNCGNPCPGPAGIVASTLTVALYPAPCPPLPPLPPPTATATISSAGGTMVLPTCAPAAPGFSTYTVGVTVPAGTPPGLYCVVGTATVTFADGTVLTQTGDTVVCLVEEAPGQPGVPRLSVELISPSFPRMAPGDQAAARYRVTNNDPSNSVQLTAFATSKQAAVRPQGGNEAQGVFTISSPFGDDFPIVFEPGANCIPLPAHPYVQPELSHPLPLLGPSQSHIVTVGIRSYGQCADGSCSESTFRVAGTFADGSPAEGCAGMSFLVDTSMPAQNCGQEVNDCNRNGIPDALDIASRRSLDQNFNAMPDECEQFITVPVFASVNPIDPIPEAPIRIQVAFNEVMPMTEVWANGWPLIRTQFLSTPFWLGVIPADHRPGPQTVYFLGKDALGGMATFIASYHVMPFTETRLLAVHRDQGNIVVSWPRQGTSGFTVQTATDLRFPMVWDTDPRSPTVVEDRNTLSYPADQPALFVRLDSTCFGPSEIRIRVFDSKGKPVAGEPVYLFEGDKGSCACDDSVTPKKCKVDALKTLRTGDGTGGTKKGQVSFCGLKNETKYTVCVKPQCGGRDPCRNNEDCTFAGTCKTVETPKNGGTINDEFNLP